MKTSEILKELKAIKEAMGNNIVSAWNEDLSNPSDAVLLEDIIDKNGEEVETEYNGWNERLEKLISEIEKSDTMEEKAVVSASHYLCNDISELPSILKRLSEYENQDEILDDSLEDIVVWEKVVNSFTVSDFLDEVGYY